MFLQAILPEHAYDTVAGQRIHAMRVKALAEAVTPLVDYFFKTFNEFNEGEGVEEFVCFVDADDWRDAEKGKDMYDLACKLEDIGCEWCRNVVGFELKRISPTELSLRFVKRTDPDRFCGSLTNQSLNGGLVCK